jgi:AraC-like DNA-binding protein
MFNLSTIYRPLTSQNPIIENRYEPCSELKPYIVTFWGTQGVNSDKVIESAPLLVIPDTCVDIIFEMDYRNNRFSGHYYGINDRPFMADTVVETPFISTFAIRFHFWAVHLFSDSSLKDSLNISANADDYFYDWNIFFESLMLSTSTLMERVPIAERFLLSKLNLDKSSTSILNAAYAIVNSKGTNMVKDVCSYSVVSQRQMERLFLTHIGTSIKKVSKLVRYQHVWQEIIYQKEFNVQDAVVKYGYTDQSHLINEFKKYHSMTPNQARLFARNQLSKYIK